MYYLHQSVTKSFPNGPLIPKWCVFCTPFLHKIAKTICRLLHLHFVGNCKTSAGSYSASPNVSAIFDCYDLAVLGLAMDTNMKATLCEQTLDNAYKAYPMLRGAILHSDYTEEKTMPKKCRTSRAKYA